MGYNIVYKQNEKTPVIFHDTWYFYPLSSIQQKMVLTSCIANVVRGVLK